MLNLDEFRAKSAYFKWCRRIQVLPQLKATKHALEAQMSALRILADWMGEMGTKGLPWKAFQKALTHNHRREGLLSAAVELSREYAAVYAQVSVIESEHKALTARVPDEWKAQVFAIAPTEVEAA